MADSRWMIMLDGKQMEGDFSAEQARELIGKNAGKPILVWTQGMPQWADPGNIPELKPPSPAAAPRPAPAPSAPAAPAPQPKPSPKIDTEKMKEQAGILKGLIDFRFQNFITTRMIPVLYVVAMILIGLVALGYFFVVGGGSVISGIRFKSGMLIFTGLAGMILVPIVAVLYLALVRMWFEVVITFFRMKENLEELVKGSGKKEKEKS